MEESTRGRVMAVVGGQYGSEGKGVIVNHIANRFGYHVRTGGPNAGHSFVHHGEVFKMQAIPCGWTNPEAAIVIGRGALVNPEILRAEVEMLRTIDKDIRHRVFVDSRAGVLDPSFHYQEGGVNGEIHARIGSTGEGVGAAREARVSRDPNKFKLFADVAKEWGLDDLVCVNTPALLNGAIKRGENVLLEGTQGSGLSLIHGPWPYVTSNDTNAAQLAADAGIPPHWVTDVLLVVRTHPIRVAGNSGPLWKETTWTDMSKKVGKSVEEKTTVTRLTRRVGEWDSVLVSESARLNAPTSVALTFADYIDPECEGVNEWVLLSPKVRDFISMVENVTEAPVEFVGTGGDGWQVAERPVPVMA